MSHATFQITTRPFRFACLTQVDETGSNQNSLRALEILSQLWGGGACLILPVGTPELDVLTRDTLRRDRPDIVIFLGQDIDFYTYLANCACQTLRVWHINDENWREQLGRFDLDALGKGIALKEIEDRHPILEDSRIRLTVIDGDGLIPELARFTHGAIAPEEIDSLAKWCGTIERVTANTDYPDFISQLARTGETLNWLDISQFGLSSRMANAERSIPPARIVLIADPGIDLPLYWNHRAGAGSSAGWSVLPLPLEYIDDSQSLDTVVDWIKTPRNDLRFDFVKLTSLAATAESLNRVARKLRARLRGSSITHVDIERDFSKRPIISRRLISQTVVTDVQLEGRIATFIPPPLKLVSSLDGRLPYMVDLDRDTSENKRPFRIDLEPEIATLDALRASTPPTINFKPDVGWTDKTLTLVARADRSLIRYEFPTDQELIEARVADRGYKIEKDDKQRTYQAALNKLGGTWPAARFFSAATRPFVYELSKKRLTPIELCRAVNQNRANGEKSLRIKDPIGNSRLKEVHEVGDLHGGLDAISEKRFKKYFERDLGYAPSLTALLSLWQSQGLLDVKWCVGTCEHCQSRQWRNTVPLEIQSICDTCGESMGFPMKMSAGFRLHDALRKTVEQGGDTVLMTARLFRSLGNQGFTYLPGLKCSFEGQVTDFDFIGTVDGYLVVGECKSRHRGWANHQDAVNTLKQFETLVDHARRLEADIAFLSLLGASLTEAQTRRIRNLADENLSVVILGGNDLEKGHPVDAGGRNMHHIQGLIREGKPRKRKSKKSASTVNKRTVRTRFYTETHTV